PSDRARARRSVALQPRRRGARPSAALYADGAAHEAAGGGVRRRADGGVQSPRRDRVVCEPAAWPPRSQPTADARVLAAAARREDDGEAQARERFEPDRRRTQALARLSWISFKDAGSLL